MPCIESTSHDNGHSQRFTRHVSQRNISIYDPSKSKNSQGTLYNYSPCGLYVESDSLIEPGTTVQLTENDAPANPLFPCPAGYVTALVRWSQKLPDQKEGSYGMGLKLCMTECDVCGNIIPADQICHSPGPLNVCPTCLGLIQGQSGGKIKTSLTRFFMGNVI